MDHREILEVVRTGIGVARIVGRYPVHPEINAQPTIREDIAERDAMTQTRTNANTILRVIGDGVSTRRRVANEGVTRRTGNRNTATAVAQGRGPVCLCPDPVPVKLIVVSATAVNQDAIGRVS